MTDKIIQQRSKICDGLHVEFTAPKGLTGFIKMTCEWDPKIPDDMSPKMLKAYYKARAEFISKI